MATGAAWMVGVRFAVRALGVVNTVVLARVLAPSDFGLLAMATLVVLASDVLSDFNFDVSIIRDRDASREAYDTVWSLSLLRAIALGAVIAALAWPAAVFWNDSRVEFVLYAFAGMMALEGLQNVGVVDFRKHMQFGWEFLFIVLPKVAGVASALSAAIAWQSYWALVIGAGTDKLTRVVLSYVIHPHRPRWSLSHSRQILGFSSWLLLNGILYFAYRRVDSLLIGRLLGSQMLGIYAIAYEIANLTTTELLAPLRRALFPGYVVMAGDPALLRRRFLQVWGVTIAVGTPIGVLTALVADPFVRIILGEQWHDATGLIRLLAFSGVLAVIETHFYPVLLALGRLKLLNMGLAIGIVMMVPLVFFGVLWQGVQGAAWAVTATNIVVVTYSGLATSRVLKIPVREVGASAWRTAASSISMALIVCAYQQLWPSHGGMLSHLWALASSTLLAATVYSLTHLGLWRLSGSPEGPETQLLTLLEMTKRSLYRSPQLRWLIHGG
jgi:lipopolysaccharide exporter